MTTHPKVRARRPVPRPLPARPPVQKASAPLAAPRSAAPVPEASAGTTARVAAKAAPAPVGQASLAEGPRALACDLRRVAFHGLASTGMFDTLSSIRATPVSHTQALAPARHTLAEARGYTGAELDALAEIAYHYLRAGGFRIARVMFEGLAALRPRDAFLALGAGLTADHLGDRPRARAWYERATHIEPDDPRGHLNLAELDLDGAERPRAVARLRRAAELASRRGEPALERKARALLSLVSARPC